MSLASNGFTSLQKFKDAMFKPSSDDAAPRGAISKETASKFLSVYGIPYASDAAKAEIVERMTSRVDEILEHAGALVDGATPPRRTVAPSDVGYALDFHQKRG